MLERELAAWLALSFTPKIGSKALARLIAVDAPCNLMDRDTESLSSLGLSREQITYFKQGSERDVGMCMEWFQASNHHILTPLDEEYPPLLKEVALPPPVLFVKGDVTTLSHPQIAMVGSRNASMEGLNSAKSYASRFVQHGLVVTSGLALGIDGHAHDGALSADGKTIAVLGSGLDQVYPSRHKGLAGRIIESGALVSEFAPQIKPRPTHFPRRNRIISGLSVGVLVVEAAEKSGSLITARYAAEQGRDVFAIPGSIYSGNNQGGNALIKNGACLVQSEQDVLDEIDTLVDWSIKQRFSSQAELFDQIESEQELPFPQLLANVGVEATPVDILASRTNIPVHEVMMQILELELSGHVVAVSGGYIRNGRG
ncbi:DNA-processing protein DprA [Vibrio genomosp. F10]|uniref:DNA-processing protein DprA n=1 Tax=Vibrio genomosp. F10 TaxID=723171 RepID=UPI0002E6D8C6|nr:DNA-processing protein DprA [Vibrio genomosp. F10]OEF03632.1 DNA protecting protein DprA [Vibrio genomosp. F10 str. 9ZD137]